MTDGGLRAAAARAAGAFADFRAYLEGTLLPRGSDRVAAGEEALALHLRHGHFLEEDAEEIVRYAETEMAAAAADTAARAGDFGAADPAGALARLEDEHPPVEGYYERYHTIWEAMRVVAVERGLLTWPEAPIRFVPIPRWACEAAAYLYFLFYRSPAAYARPPVHDVLVTPIEADMPRAERDRLLRAHNDGVIKLNYVIHHGGIGHHVQNARAFRAASRVGRVAAVDCASRIAMFCGGTMAEGWACYATDLMAEAGALTPLEVYAERHARVRMCARAVVDVRLHQGRMTLAEAIAYYRERAGMPEAAARAEAVKNSMFPGAALMYLAGTDAIHRLRREVERLRGDAYDLAAFHDEFLSYGSVPVALVAKDMVRRYGERRGRRVAPGAGR